MSVCTVPLEKREESEVGRWDLNPRIWWLQWVNQPSSRELEHSKSPNFGDRATGLRLMLIQIVFEEMHRNFERFLLHLLLELTLFSSKQCCGVFKFG